MFWDGVAENDISAVAKDVAQMLGRFLRTAHKILFLNQKCIITPSPAGREGWGEGGIEIDTEK